MNEFDKHIELYNRNIYISILKQLFLELKKVEDFINKIGSSKSFHSIDNLAIIYENIFSENTIKSFVNFKTEKIHKPLYIIQPEFYSKGNSYFHITLSIKNSGLIWLDNLYGNLLSRLIKLYKHLFSKIDNYFITQNSTQLKKYQKILELIKEDVLVFIEHREHREIISKRKKLSVEQLSRISFGGLFYITHINNIQSILQLGILSHNKAHQNGFVNIDISNQQVNERRNRIEPTLGGNVHDFAPLFINPKNPTFYYWCKRENLNNLVLLRINPHILLADNVAFSDGNAAVKSTLFYKNIEDFNKLNWTIIQDNYWTQYPDGKRIKCSEVLVQDAIPIYYINNLFVYSQDTLEKILPLFPNHLGIVSSINKDLYF